jgi:hypothetical protein
LSQDDGVILHENNSRLASLVRSFERPYS